MPMLPQPGDCLPTDYGFDLTHRLEKTVTADAMTVAKIPSPGCIYHAFRHNSLHATILARNIRKVLSCWALSGYGGFNS